MVMYCIDLNTGLVSLLVHQIEMHRIYLYLPISCSLQNTVIPGIINVHVLCFLAAQQHDVCMRIYCRALVVTIYIYGY